MCVYFMYVHDLQSGLRKEQQTRWRVDSDDTTPQPLISVYSKDPQQSNSLQVRRFMFSEKHTFRVLGWVTVMDSQNLQKIYIYFNLSVYILRWCVAYRTLCLSHYNWANNIQKPHLQVTILPYSCYMMKLLSQNSGFLWCI